MLGTTDQLVFCKSKSVKPFRSYSCAKATHPKSREKKRPFLRTFSPQNAPETLPKSTENGKTGVFDAQDHEEFIFHDPKPLSLTVLAQKQFFEIKPNPANCNKAHFYPPNTPTIDQKPVIAPLNSI